MGRGGSEITAMHVVQALAPDHDVSLVTTGNVDLAYFNVWAGTSVAARDVEIVSMKLPWPLRGRESAAALRGGLHLRHLRSLVDRFDVMIGAYNLIDVGRPAIHLIADFSWDAALRAALDAGESELGDAAPERRGLVRGAYEVLVRRLAPATGRDLWSGEDLVLANSRWSAALLQEHFGATVEVLHPPVPAEPGVFAQPQMALDLDDDSTAERFVTIGRVSPEKRIETMVEILAGVRTLGREVELHVAGAWDEDGYGRALKRRLEREAPWVRFHGGVAGMAKWEFLRCGRFGIHACRREAFGIAVAEMVRAGLMPFTPSRGGAAEIVADPRLQYASVREGVRRIVDVLESDALQAELETHLAASRHRFDDDRFREQIRSAVGEFLRRV